MKKLKFIRPKFKTKRDINFFGNNSFTISVNEYEKITKSNIKYFSGRTEVKYLNQPTYCLSQKIKKYTGLYSGKIKNKKAHGWGKEILIIDGWDPFFVEEYYEGEWKNGKRHGYGESYSYHPLVGYSNVHDPSEGVKRVVVYPNDNGRVYKGQWKNGNYYKGVQNWFYCIEEGEFKTKKKNTNVLWNGLTTETVFDKNFEKKKWKVSNGKHQLLETIIEKGADKKIKKILKMNEIFFKTFLKFLPKEIKILFDKKNYFLPSRRWDPIFNKSKNYKYKINRAYYKKDYNFYTALDEKPKTKPSDLVPSVHIFKKRYKKNLKQKDLNKLTEFTDIGYFEDFEIYLNKSYRKNMDKIKKESDKIYKNQK